MRAATVEDVAQEFMRIRAEGWNPDPEEFLHRVPEDLREDCRARLEELIGEVDDQAATELAQQPEPDEVHVEEGLGDDEMIVFELDGGGPMQTVRVPSVDMAEAEADDPEEVQEMEADHAEELVEPTIAIAVETALEPEPVEVEEAEAVEVEQRAVVEPETVPVEIEEAVAAEAEESELEEPEIAEIEEASIEEAETVEVPEPEVVEPDVVEPEIAEAETAEIAEPVAAAQPEPEPEPKPQGLVKLTKEEAKAMFKAMERNRK